MDSDVPLNEQEKGAFSPMVEESRKVDFVIAGAMKSGTSALDTYLREHTEICMATPKEVHFFDDEKLFREARVDYDHYHSFFKPTEQHRRMGESTQIYMYWQDCPKRLWQYNPDMKIIIVLRNPIDRAHSMRNMQVVRGLETLSFWDALQKESERGRENLPFQSRRYSYMDRGFYVEQLRRVWKFFPPDQTLILKSENLKREPTATLNRIASFLGVSGLEEVRKKGSQCQSVFSDEREGKGLSSECIRV
ncbi:MAG: sulfotransferase domain-containing protein [Deltaproteobacteria bacterium]|nr:sulfotransferase domain-containing protein [Deltaproteobacteria bacterium]